MRLDDVSPETLSGGFAPSPSPGPDSAYWSFYEEVAAAQVAAWAPEQPARVLDLSGGSQFAGQLADLGHDVLHVGPSPTGRGLTAVLADPRALGWLRDGSVDAVLAEAQLLSMCLAAEVTVEDLLRVLRPGGRLLLVVDSLLLGLARLADQGRWAELADVPAADVVLVTAADGTISRCFSPTELRALLTAAGFEVDWVRPRSVLAPSAVERALAEDPAALPTLVRSELALSQEREGESTGNHLVVSARRPD
jgi:SAM-dependent methyltransferase